MENTILCAVVENESHYIKASGYWVDFYEAALDLRSEYLSEEKSGEALQSDVWGLVGIRYGLRVVGLRPEVYKMAA